jgi:trehalose 6-phosphate phosphatase
MRGNEPVTPAILDAVSTESGTQSAALRASTEALRADPAHTAILTDVDGTLAPIVARPELAAVPARAREALRRLNKRYGLVGCISGRRAAEARRLVCVEDIAYAGNHGLELLLPGEESPRLDPSLAGRDNAVAEFVAGLGEGALAEAGLRLEDKGPIQALHWRGAGPGAGGGEAAAEARAREIAVAAERASLGTHWGRKVLELRPPARIGKDAAVGALLAGGEIDAAAYAGDDRTDLDAFRRLRDLRESGTLDAAVCVGVISEEAPPELAEECDLQVEGPDGWLALLEALAV